jgi:hypothetical protein
MNQMNHMSGEISKINQKIEDKHNNDLNTTLIINQKNIQV